MQTFSGGYVHVLKGALSEDLLIQSFQKMGYVRRDAHRLMVAALPPAHQLVQVALGCFALRLECEILGEVLAQLGTSVLPAEELLQARRASEATSGPKAGRCPGAFPLLTGLGRG